VASITTGIGIGSRNDGWTVYSDKPDGSRLSKKSNRVEVPHGVGKSTICAHIRIFMDDLSVGMANYYIGYCGFCSDFIEWDFVHYPNTVKTDAHNK